MKTSDPTEKNNLFFLNLCPTFEKDNKITGVNTK